MEEALDGKMQLSANIFVYYFNNLFMIVYLELVTYM